MQGHRLKFHIYKTVKVDPAVLTSVSHSKDQMKDYISVYL